MNENSKLQTHPDEFARLPEAVACSDERFRDIFEHAIAGIYQSSVAGKFLTANPALARMLGCASVARLMDLDIGKELYVDVDVRRENMRILQETGKLTGVEFKLRRADGQVILVEEHARAVTSADGNVLYYEGTLTDVTERRRAQEALLESEAQYRVIAETANDCIITIDAASRILFVNHAVEKMFGYSPAEVTGELLTLLMPERLRATHRAGLGRYLASGEKRLNWGATQAHGLHKDAFEIPVEISFGEHPLAGSRAFTGIIRDVSERQRDRERLAAYAQQLRESNLELKTALSAAQEASMTKAQFLANMSHEIRTPMNAILGMSAVLLETPLTKEQNEYARTMNDAVADLLTVLNDVLDVSRMETGQLAMESREFEIRVIVEKAMQLMSRAAAEKGLAFTRVVAPDVPTIVGGDSTRLRQVLVNLVGNAVKFTDRGGVEVRVMDSGASAEAAILVRFEVRDTGIGMESEAIPRLFQAFAQADGTLTRKYGGAGLGLTISRQLVEKMGGIITVESELGRGSVFAFTVPFQKISAAYDAAPSTLTGDDSSAAPPVENSHPAPARY